MQKMSTNGKEHELLYAVKYLWYLLTFDILVCT